MMFWNSDYSPFTYFICYYVFFLNFMPNHYLTADALVSSGLASLGYTYVNIGELLKYFSCMFTCISVDTNTLID